MYNYITEVLIMRSSCVPNIFKPTASQHYNIIHSRFSLSLKKLLVKKRSERLMCVEGLKVENDPTQEWSMFEQLYREYTRILFFDENCIFFVKLHLQEKTNH